MEGKVCTVCTDVVAVVRYLLTDPNLETMIKTYAEAVCSATGPLAPLVNLFFHTRDSNCFLPIRLLVILEQILIVIVALVPEIIHSTLNYHFKKPAWLCVADSPNFTV